MKLEQWLPQELSQDIFNKKYRYEDETMDEWFERVSAGNKEVAQMIREKKFIFGGRILANRGLHKLGRKVTYSNCYVLAAPEDNLESIFQSATEMARTFSYGGGVGIDISKLAPKGAVINNAARETSGSVSFMDLYSLTTGLIGQNGRRGATMISISSEHPDLLDFIDVKNDPERVTKANISIRITNAFMKAALENKEHKLKYTRETTGETISKVVNAREVLKKIAQSNWNMAEPGLLYWDRISNWNLFSEDDSIEYAGVNPCAEEPLPAYGSCLLASINLAAFILDPFTDRARFDFEEFSKTVIGGTKALNEVLHEGLPLHPLKQQQESVNDLRQIGLGLFGFHDTLIQMGITYGDEKCLTLIDNIGSLLINESLKESARLTDVYGAYPKYNAEAVLKSEFLNTVADEDTILLIKEKGLANSQILTVPPTGSIATMLGVSTALEPMYSISYTRKTESLHGEDKYYKVFTPIVKQYMDTFKIEDEKQLPECFNTTQSIHYLDRIKVQGKWQKYIDASISSTINVPEEFTVEEVEDLYMQAWIHGLKGVTIFRDNCFRTGILTTGEQEEEMLERGQIIKAPSESLGKTYKLVTGCGNAYLTVSWDKDGNIVQTFTNKGSSGTCRSNQEAVSRLVSLALRGGISIESVIDQLKSVDVCPSYVSAKARGKKVTQGSSCPYTVAVTLERALKEGKELFQMKDEVIVEEDVKEEPEPQVHTIKCPECGVGLAVEGGCITCRNCGYGVCN